MRRVYSLVDFLYWRNLHSNDKLNEKITVKSYSIINASSLIYYLIPVIFHPRSCSPKPVLNKSDCVHWNEEKRFQQTCKHFLAHTQLCVTFMKSSITMFTCMSPRCFTYDSTMRPNCEIHTSRDFHYVNKLLLSHNLCLESVHSTIFFHASWPMLYPYSV